jgi:diguanylate cyclase (GGDEF)-like protein
MDYIEDYMIEDDLLDDTSDDSAKKKKKESSKVLVVDDSEDILILVQNILSLESFVAVPISNASKALEIVDDSFDAIVLDLMMPGMSGTEFLLKFREKKEYNHIPVLVLTAKNYDEEEVANIFRMGANDYIIKPFLKDEFTARVKVHAKLKKNTETLHRINKKLLKKYRELQKAVKKEEVLNEKILERTVELKEANDKIAELNKALEYSATHDVLTEILNRGAILAFLENDIRRAKRIRSSLSLMMFDIDLFKKINDNYGHLVGDSILRQLASIVKDAIRDIDLFGRYGGEEFIIILPDTNINQAKILATRILQRVQDTNFLTNKIELKVTISIGVTEFIAEETVDQFIERTDEALYEAKSAGRNCIKFK